MRDKKDNATFDLPGFDPAPAPDISAVEPKRASQRERRTGAKQEQLALLDLDAADASGLPKWQRDPSLDLSGLPIWQPST